MHGAPGSAAPTPRSRALRAPSSCSRVRARRRASSGNRASSLRWLAKPRGRRRIRSTTVCTAHSPRCWDVAPWARPARGWTTFEPMRDPQVSVVMGVYNGAAALPATMRSVLDQEGCALEIIVVDDGSSDDTPRLLDEWAARDARLRVIHQANTGLTGALIRGCGEVRGEFIARQDCGDRSLPGRLRSQAALLA